jgi:hypothetical protein
MPSTVAVVQILTLTATQTTPSILGRSMALQANLFAIG